MLGGLVAAGEDQLLAYLRQVCEGLIPIEDAIDHGGGIECAGDDRLEYDRHLGARLDEARLEGDVLPVKVVEGELDSAKYIPVL